MVIENNKGIHDQEDLWRLVFIEFHPYHSIGTRGNIEGKPDLQLAAVLRGYPNLLIATQRDNTLRQH